MKQGYDPACETLAEHFLCEDDHVAQGDYASLAQYIQDAVETWLQYRENHREVEP